MPESERRSATGDYPGYLARKLGRQVAEDAKNQELFQMMCQVVSGMDGGMGSEAVGGGERGKGFGWNREALNFDMVKSMMKQTRF